MTASLLRTAVWSVVYLLATLAGRKTILDGGSLSLVWPAAGISVLWFATQRRARLRWLDPIALAAVTVGVNAATGADLPLALWFVVANLAQVAVFTRLLRRLSPHLWGAGGSAPLARSADLWRHDLLNPLTTIDGWAENLGDTLRTMPLADPAVRDAGDSLVRITRASARMRHLINDLLAYTTARNATIAPVDVSLHDLLAEVTAARADLAAAAGTPPPEFALGHLDVVRADPVLLRQLLDNLIGNAVKYTAAGTVPRIAISSSRTPESFVRVEIADNGIGIPPGQHEAIVTNFHRAHRSSGYAGTGLGLAICKRIVERHGGTIAAADNPETGGSRFTFTLPAAARVEAPTGVSLVAI